jgi:hypothetical protein
VATQLRIAGTGARLCWGYHTVAELGAWSIDGGVLIAQSVRVLNPIWLTQRDLELVIPRGDGRPPWRRRLSHVVVEQTTLNAQLVRAPLEVTV